MWLYFSSEVEHFLSIITKEYLKEKWTWPIKTKNDPDKCSYMHFQVELGKSSPSMVNFRDANKNTNEDKKEEVYANEKDKSASSIICYRILTAPTCFLFVFCKKLLDLSH